MLLALALVRKTDAELLVVKLRVAQMPYADKFQLHIYAALAEQERDFISERTKAALKVAKERGVKLGGMRDATMKRNEAIQQKANAEAARLMKVIGPMLKAETPLNRIARTLNEMGIATSRGGSWTATQVSGVVERAGRQI